MGVRNAATHNMAGLTTSLLQKGSVTLGQNEIHHKANDSKFLNLKMTLTLAIFVPLYQI